MKRTLTHLALGVAATALICAPAQAGPWLTTASGVAVGDITEVSGGGYAAEASIDLEILDPIGQVTITEVTTDASGNLIVEVSLNHGGEYVVDAFPAGGAEVPLATTVIVAAE